MVKSKNTQYRNLKKFSSANAKRRCKRMSFKCRGGSGASYVDYTDVDKVIDVILHNIIAGTEYTFDGDNYVLWQNQHGICIQGWDEWNERATTNKYCISSTKKTGYKNNMLVNVNLVKDFFGLHLPALCILFRPISINQLAALLSLCEIENDTSEISRYKYPIENNYIQGSLEMVTICKHIGYESYILSDYQTTSSQIKVHKIALLAILLGKHLQQLFEIKSANGYYYIELDTTDHYRIITKIFEIAPHAHHQDIIIKGINIFNPYSVRHIYNISYKNQILSYLQAINKIIFINVRYLGNYRNPPGGCITL
jgi:hypothetical protein